MTDIQKQISLYWKKIPRRLRKQNLPYWMYMYIQHGPLWYHHSMPSVTAVYIPSPNQTPDEAGIAALRISVQRSPDIPSKDGRLAIFKASRNNAHPEYYYETASDLSVWMLFPELRPFLAKCQKELKRGVYGLRKEDTAEDLFLSLQEYQWDLRHEDAAKASHPYKMLGATTPIMNNPSIFEE